MVAKLGLSKQVITDMTHKLSVSLFLLHLLEN